MKLLINFLLIATIQIESSWTRDESSSLLYKLTHADSMECIDPSNQYLEFLYTEYLSSFRIYEEQMIISKNFTNANTNNNNNEISVNIAANDESEFMSNDHCKEHTNHERSQISQGGQSLCPWVYAISYRLNKYPRFVC